MKKENRAAMLFQAKGKPDTNALTRVRKVFGGWNVVLLVAFENLELTSSQIHTCISICLCRPHPKFLSVQSLAVRQTITGRLNPWAFSLQRCSGLRRLSGWWEKVLGSLQLWPSSWVSCQYSEDESCKNDWSIYNIFFNNNFGLKVWQTFFCHLFSQMCLLIELNINKIVSCNLYIEFRQTDLNAYWNKQSQESRKTPYLRQSCGALLHGIMGASPARHGIQTGSWAHTCHFFKCVIVFELLVVRK